MTDNVNHPKHYTALGAECECGRPIEVIKITERMDFVLGNAVKYILRAPFEGNELEDLKEAQWYLNRAVDAKEGWHNIGYTTNERVWVEGYEPDEDEEAIAAWRANDEALSFEIKTNADPDIQRLYFGERVEEWERLRKEGRAPYVSQEEFDEWLKEAKSAGHEAPSPLTEDEVNEWLGEDRGYKFRPYSIPEMLLQPYLDAMGQTVKQVTHPTFFPSLSIEVTETTKEMLQDAIKEWRRKQEQPLVPEWVLNSFAGALEQMEQDSALLAEHVKKKTDIYDAAWKQAFEMAQEIVDTVEWRDPKTRSQAAEAEIGEHFRPRVHVGFDDEALATLDAPKTGDLWQEEIGEQIYYYDGTTWSEW